MSSKKDQLQPKKFFNEKCILRSYLMTYLELYITQIQKKNVVHFKYMQFIVSQLHIHDTILKSNIQNFSFYNHSAMVYELHS